MTGIYFSGTGLSYQFPPGFSCPPQGILQLANHLETFEHRYGISPFGEFSRNLNNNGQLLTLSDAFGNIIDEVNYSNEYPWPAVAGNGMYLKLQDVNSDNNIASNWIASNEQLTTNVVAGIDEQIQLDLFPNP
ncbi:secretion system protein Por, partial [bacterium]|nr:secretion system protein Por [bacterium]